MSNLSDKKLSQRSYLRGCKTCNFIITHFKRFPVFKEALNIVTFNPDFEQMLITMSKKSSAEGLLIDPSLAKEMIQSLIEIGDKFSSEGNSLVIVTSPVIRKDLSILLRPNI